MITYIYICIYLIINLVKYITCTHIYINICLYKLYIYKLYKLYSKRREFNKVILRAVPHIVFFVVDLLITSITHPTNIYIYIYTYTFIYVRLYLYVDE